MNKFDWSKLPGLISSVSIYFDDNGEKTIEKFVAHGFCLNCTAELQNNNDVYCANCAKVLNEPTGNQ